MSRRVAVAATAAFGADVLERLAATHDVTSLVTRPDAPAGRGRKLHASPAKQTAERLGIPVLEPERLEPGLDVGAPVVVAVAYGLIVPEPVLGERLWLNVHPSLLPRWRGAAPVERALMAGDPETGVSIIRLVKELDAGPIAAQRPFAGAPRGRRGRRVRTRRRARAPSSSTQVLAEPEPSYPRAGGRADLRRQDHRQRTAASTSTGPRGSSSITSGRSRRTSGRGRSSTAAASRSGGLESPEDGSFEPLEVQPDGSRRMTYDAWLRGLRQ